MLETAQISVFGRQPDALERKGAASRSAPIVALLGIVISQAILVADQLFRAAEPLGLIQLWAACFALIPTVIFWSRMPVSYRTTLMLPRVNLRAIAVGGVVAAMVITRLHTIVAGMHSGIGLGRGLLIVVLLIPALMDCVASMRDGEFHKVGCVSVQEANGRARWAQSTLQVGLVVVLPICFLWLAPFQHFPPPGWVDPAIYAGYFLDLPDMLRRFGGTYFALRLSWILPGYILHLIFPPVLAYGLLVSAFYLLGVGSLYATAVQLWGRSAAIIAVAVLAYNPLYIRAVTQGYVDGAYVAYLLAQLACLTTWARTDKKIFIIGAGACGVLAVVAHSVAGLYGAFVFVFYVVVMRRTWAEIVADISYMAVGGALVLLFFVFAAASAGFNTDSFLHLRWVMTSSLQGLGSNYREPLHQWVPMATRIVPPLAALAITILLVAVSGSRNRRDLSAAVMFLALSMSFLPLYDWAVGGSTTQTLFYWSLVLPALCVSVGAIAAAVLPERPPFRWAAAFLFTAACAVTAAAGQYLYVLALQEGLRLNVTVFGVSALVLLAILAMPWMRRTVATLVVLPVIGTAITLAFAVNAAATGLVYKLPGGIDYVEFYRAAGWVRQALSVPELKDRQLLFWFHRGAFATRVGTTKPFTWRHRFGASQNDLSFYDTIVGLYLWDRSLYRDSLTDSDAIPRTMLSGDQQTIVLLSQDRKALHDALSALERAGLSCTLQRELGYSSTSFNLIIDIINLLPAPSRVSTPSCRDPRT